MKYDNLGTKEEIPMKSQAGKVFSIAENNPSVPGCTISSKENDQLYTFSLAPETSISEETYARPKLWLMMKGTMEVTNHHEVIATLHEGDLYSLLLHTPIGVIAKEEAIYVECEGGETMNAVTAGQVMALKDLVPYQEGKIINRDIINNETTKFVIMSFDAGTGLSEHAAPGDALIFALDGEAIITYEGVEHRIHAGENFKFDHNGRHAVTADHQFKMALLIELAD